MKQRTERSIKTGIINTFGSFGYLFCFLQWIWAVILYLSVIQSVSSFVSSSSDMRPVEHASNASFTLPEPLGAIILAAIVIVMVIVTIYALISVPRNIVETSNKVVHKTAEAIVPAIIKAQHKHDTKKLRITITSRLIFAIKVLVIVVPIALTGLSGLLEKQLIDYSIAMIIGYGLACFSVMFFSVQYLFAKLMRVKFSNIW